MKRLPFLVLYLCSILVTGYDVHIDNHPLQIPIVHRLADPGAYPGDPFVDTAPYYASVLWRAVALATPIVPPMLQLFLLFLLERALLLFSFRALARAIAPGSNLAALGAMTFAVLAPRPFVAHGTIVTSYLEQTGLSIPCFVFCIAAYLAGRPLACAVWLALGFDLNSLYGIYAISYLGPMLAVDGSFRKAWPKGIAAVLIFLALAAPAIALSLQSYFRSGFDPQLWLWASAIRFPHHLHPSSFSKANLAQLVSLLGLVSCVAWANRSRLGRASKHALVWAITAGGWLILAFVAPIAGRPALLALQPGRGCDLWLVFGGIFLICVAARALAESRIDLRLAAIAFFASIAIWFTPPVTPVLAVPLLVALIPSVFARSDEAGAGRLAHALVLLALAVAVVSVSRRAVRERSLLAGFGSRPDPGMTELAEWAERNTPRDAAFLVNPDWAEFRALSGRPVFATWKDGAAMLWDRPFVGEWVRRMQPLGLEPGVASSSDDGHAAVARGYEKLSDQDVQKLRERFRVDYWIVPKSRASSFPVVFANDHHRVLALAAR